MLALQPMQRMARQDAFLALVQVTRSELDSLYRSSLEPEQMLAQKAAILDDLRSRYARLRASWGGYPGYGYGGYPGYGYGGYGGYPGYSYAPAAPAAPSTAPAQ